MIGVTEHTLSQMVMVGPTTLRLMDDRLSDTNRAHQWCLDMLLASVVMGAMQGWHPPAATPTLHLIPPASAAQLVSLASLQRVA